MEIHYPTLNAARRVLYKRRFYRFLMHFWDVVVQEDYVDNFHISEICDELQRVGEILAKREPRQHDLVINVPPGTSKSTIVSVMWPAWLWAIDPTIRIISASYEDALAQVLAMKSRDIIKSEKYRALFPEVQIRPDIDGAKHYENTLGGERKAVGSKGTITGTHAHVIVIDDPINPKAADSEAERDAVNRWLSGTIPTRKVDKAVTATVLVMQRLHDNDPTAEFKRRNKKVKNIVLPARLSADVQPPELADKYVDGLLDPVRLSEAMLQEAELMLNFDGQFMQRPNKAGGDILKPEWIKRFNLVDLLNHAAKSGVKLIWNYEIDPAYTAKKKNDATAIICYCVYRKKAWIREVYNLRMEMPDLMEALPNILRSTGYTGESEIHIEPKASGLTLIQLLQKEGFNAFNSYAPDSDKIVMANSITPKLKAGFVMLANEAEGAPVLISQMESFPKGQNDDTVDGLIMTVKNGLNENGLLASG